MRGSLARRSLLSFMQIHSGGPPPWPQQFIRTDTSTAAQRLTGIPTSKAGGCLFSAPRTIQPQLSRKRHGMPQHRSLRIPSPLAHGTQYTTTYLHAYIPTQAFLIKQSSRFIYKRVSPMHLSTGTMQSYYFYPSFHSPFISDLEHPAFTSLAQAKSYCSYMASCS